MQGHTLTLEHSSDYLHITDMWRPSHRPDASNDVFHDSPYLTASPGLLTPPSAYRIDARRHSTASKLSLHGPTTPVYGLSPFSDHSHGSVTIVDESQDGYMDTLSMGYSYKPSASFNNSFDN